MIIIGCDSHPGFQQIAYIEQETGEYGERRLGHRGEALAFYRSLAGRAVRIGVEPTGYDRWFRKLISELGHELLVGDASAIHASAPREQRTDKRDVRHIPHRSCSLADRFVEIGHHEIATSWEYELPPFNS